MSSEAMPRMSLVAQYDDLCRYTKVLTSGCEQEFKTFVELQRSMLNKFKDVEYEMEEVRIRNSVLEEEREKFEFRINEMKHLIEEERQKKKKVEQGKICVEKQLALIKDVLLANGNTIDEQTKEKIFSLSNTSYNHSPKSRNRLSTLGESATFLLSQVDFDDTIDDIVGATGLLKHHSKRSGGRFSDRLRKKKKSEERIQLPNANLEVNVAQNTIPQKELNEEYSPDSRHSDKGHSRVLRSSISRMSTQESTPKESVPEGNLHCFVPKYVRSPTLFCYVCGKKFKFFESVQMCTNCETYCHMECEKHYRNSCHPKKNSTPVVNNTENLREMETIEIAPVQPLMLGPLYDSSEKSKNLRVSPLKPRNRRKSKSGKQIKFLSPLIQ